MGHSCIRAKVRRRKVAFLASKSRKTTVKNCTIRKGTVTDGTWEVSQEYRDIKKKRVDVLDKNRHGEDIDKKRRHCAWYFLQKKEVNNLWKDRIPKKMNHTEYMERLVQEKLKKWEKKNPCPIDDDPKQHDMFEAEFLPTWKFEKEKAEERIRDFVVSVYDKLDLTGRYKQSDSKFTENLVVQLKDENGEGHHINDLNPETSKVLKKAQKATNEEKKRNPKLVATNLKDHKKKRGRILLPKAA